jgi:citrate synthase
MLTGEPPDEQAAKTFDVALILHADHEMNASTFTARVIASTLSDMHSAITGAIGALKGPLHGGANEQVMHLLAEIGSDENIEQEIRGRLDRKERIMGFGHRVYKTYDPRAVILKRFSKALSERSDEPHWFAMSEHIENAVLEEKGLYPNVDFYSASTYHYLGIETGLFTPIFAMSRVVGWAAHVIEQHGDNRLIRPSSEYVGPAPRAYEPIDQRTAHEAA